MPENSLPEHPLDRFLELLDALMEHKRWFEDPTALRFAASSLLTTPGPAAQVATELQDVAEQLKDDAGWFGPLNSAVRFVVAAMLLRSDKSTREFCAEIERVEELFKQHKLKRGTTYTYLAAMLLIDNGQRSQSHVGSDQVARFAALYAEMKSHHLFLTGQDDYPTCALLSSLPGTPSELGQRCEVFYEGLRDLGFKRGNALQTVSHMLVFAPDDDGVVMQRFRRLYDGFDKAGLWMHTGDYDEVAALSFLPHETANVVATVLNHRESIAKHPPKPGRELSFSLACGTGFLELAGDQLMSEHLRGTQNILAVQAIIQAQQAAMIAAAVSASAAASSASHG